VLSGLARGAGQLAARVKNAREVILHLGIQALEENGDWLLLHRDRPIKIVT
jgi:hypothetical protein